MSESKETNVTLAEGSTTARSREDTYQYICSLFLHALEIANHEGLKGKRLTDYKINVSRDAYLDTRVVITAGVKGGAS